jgi:hypothetical protein
MHPCKTATQGCWIITGSIIYDGMRNPPIKFTITVTTPKIFKYNFFAKNKKITYDQDEVIKKYKK